jgi:hypothetical protein
VRFAIPRSFLPYEIHRHEGGECETGDLELMFALERTPLGSFAIMFANRLKEPIEYGVGGAERLAFGRESWWAPAGHLRRFHSLNRGMTADSTSKLIAAVGAVRIAVSDLQSMRRGGRSEGTSYGYKNC